MDETALDIVDVPEVDVEDLEALLEQPHGADNEEEGEATAAEHGAASDRSSEADDGEVDHRNVDAEMEALRQAEGEVTSEELQAMSKSEAKQLGKGIYKAWKKLHKKSKKDKKEKKAEKGESKKKRSRGDDDDDGDKEAMNEIRERRKSGRKSKLTEDVLEAAAYEQDPFIDQQEPLRRRHVTKEPKPKKTAAGKVRFTPAQQRDANIRDAQGLVEEMRRAQKADEAALRQKMPPLNRLSLITRVLMTCRREAMQEPLIGAGFLEVISLWLFDPVSKEVAPLDLRTTALNALLAFDYEGTNSARLQRWQEKERELIAKDKETLSLDYFRGIRREHLEQSDLGEAVNALRQHPQETLGNRSSAIGLLQRFSRSWNAHLVEDYDDDDERRQGVQWKCKDDPTVAPPFDPIRSAAERFHATVSAVDPLDPMAYLKQAPKRYQKGYITNLKAIKL